MSRNQAQARRALQSMHALRVALSAFMIVHGVARAWLGLVDEFGAFLETWAIPQGLVVAWAITVFEIAGGAALAVGAWVRPLAGLFALQLVAGVAMVHWPEGWFVVGAGRNGMEYSALLIAGFLAVAWTGPATRRR